MAPSDFRLEYEYYIQCRYAVHDKVVKFTVSSARIKCVNVLLVLKVAMNGAGDLEP